MAYGDESEEAVQCRERLEQCVSRWNMLKDMRIQSARQKCSSEQKTDLEEFDDLIDLEALQSSDNSVDEPQLPEVEEIDIQLKDCRTEYELRVWEYSKALCKPIAEAVQERLPPELRNQIYEHLAAHLRDSLTPPSTFHALDLGLIPSSNWRTVGVNGMRPFTNRRFPHHFEQTDIVGLQFARELVQVYFRLCMFLIRVENLYALDVLLERELPGYNLQISEHLRRVGLEYDVTSGLNSLRAFEDLWCARYVDVEAIKETFAPRKQAITTYGSAILRARSLREFQIKLKLYEKKEAGYYHFLELVDALLPIITELKSRGVAVVFEMDMVEFFLDKRPKTMKRRCLSKWCIPDTPQAPIDRVLAEILEEIRPQCDTDHIDPTLVRKFHAMVPDSLRNTESFVPISYTPRFLREEAS